VVEFSLPTFSDNSGKVTIARTDNGPASAEEFPVGITTVSYTATDAAGNTASCSFDVTVKDNEDPVFDAVSNLESNVDAGACSAVVSFEIPTATDNCDGTTVTQTSNTGSGDTFPVGTTTVTYTATDASGNTDTISFDVIVTDNEDPTISCPADITSNVTFGETGAVVTYDAVTFNENCSATIEQTAGLASGETFPVGTTTNTFVVTDASGNTATCSFDITIKEDGDTVPPTITCPDNIEQNVNQGVCGAVVEFSLPTFSDNSGKVTIARTDNGPASAEEFPVGITTVSYTATDAAGNTASCSFDVTVKDNEDPVFDAVSNLESNVDAGACSAVVSFEIPTATDNCDGTTVTQTSELGPGSIFPVGTTTVTYTATDASGNTDTVSFDVIVTDNEDPTITCPADITTTNVIGQNYALVTYTEITATDNCEVAVERTSGFASGEQFPVGITTVTYVATDINGNSVECSFTVTVKGSPVAVDDAESTDEDTPVIIAVLDNDSDLDNDPLSVTETTTPANGTVVINEDGTITYTPNPDFNGTDSFEYTITDGNGGFDTAIVTVTIGGTNDAPVAVDDAASTDEDTPVVIAVLGNDSDPDNDPLTITETTTPENGSVVINEDGTITYTPNPDFNGTDSFEYTITDGNGGFDTAIVTVTIGGTNDAPVAVDDAASTEEDTPVIIAVLDNDSDPDNDPLTITETTTPANGSVVINEDGTITYTPNPDFNGTDSFEYTINDGNGGFDTAIVTVTVIGAENVAPIAVDDAASTDEDTPVIITVLDNDSDPDNDPLTITETTTPENGTVVINEDGTITYTPNPDFNGTDTFEYTITDGNGGFDTAIVTVTIGGTNDEPIAVDDAASTEEDTPVVIAVLDNDSDPDNDPLSVTETTTPANGTVVINEDGTITYTPNPDFNGTDSFEYTITDGNGGFDTAIVTVTVIGAENVAPIAVDDAESTEEDTPVVIAVLENDSDPDNDPLTITEAISPANGSVIINEDGTITYTPNPDFNGTDSFEYTITDGNGGFDTAIVTVTIGGTNDVPVAVDDAESTDEDIPVVIAVLDNDSDPDNDPLTITETTTPANGTVVINEDGTITYTPNPDFNGTDSFEYTITDDNGGFDTAIVTVTVIGAENVAPIAVDDAESTDEDIPVVIAVLDNDSDPDNDPLTITETTTPANGSVVINEDGTITYTPNPDFNGTDSFEYTITDGNGGFDTAIVTVTIGGTNDEPIAVDDAASTDEDTPVVIAVLGNDSDPDNDPLTITETTTPENGSLVINEDGTITYIPNPDFNGTDSFEYNITDGNGGFDTAIVTVTVIGAENVAPIAVDDAASTEEDTPVIIAVLDNDSDPDNDPLTITETTTPTNGTVVINEDGTITYTPNEHFNGTDTFEYTITDGNGGFDTAVVTVTVIGAENVAPIAVDDAASTDEDTPVVIGVLDNDSDPDNDPLSVTESTTPANGSLVINEDGTITYTPNENYNGTDSFEYTITDGNGGFDTAIVTVTIGDTNDAPVAVDDAESTEEDTPVIIAVLGNDSDPDNEPLTITETTSPANGSVVINENGTITYTPNENFNGTDTFEYTITDGNGGFDTAIVTVTVIGAENVAPIAVDDAASTEEDTPVIIAVLDNDSDPDNDPLTITETTTPENGNVVINEDGTITYTPNENFNGTDTFEYTITDGKGGFDTAIITITVEQSTTPPAPEAPEVTITQPTCADPLGVTALEILSLRSSILQSRTIQSSLIITVT